MTPIRLQDFSHPLVFLAPMEGVVDWVLRDVLTRLGGIDLCVTEFIRVTDRLLPKNEFFKYCPELKTQSQTRAGVPVLIQLLGGQPGPLAENARLAMDLGAPGIDLNFGCPAKTVNRHDGGASLLKTPMRVYDVVKAVRAAVPEPFSVSAKVRLGFSDKTNFLDIARAAEDAGASWLTVHARTRDEGYRPPAHWEYIAQIRETLSIPVIGNGDIWSQEDYLRCRTVTGCTHLMLGRGLLARPDLGRQVRFNEVAQAWPHIQSLLPEFAQMSQEFRHEHYGVARVKQWLKQMTRTYPEAVVLFENLKRLQDLPSVLALIAGNSSAPPATPAPQ